MERGLRVVYSFENRCKRDRTLNQNPQRLHSLEMNMEMTPLLDLVTGGLALAVLIGGLLMLFNGISAFGGKDK